METVGPGVEILKCIRGPISRRIGYVKNLKKNFEKLRRVVLYMQARMEDVQGKINNVGGRPTRKCAVWLKEAEGIQKKWKEIEEEYQKDKTCLGGWCPNVSARFNLGKRVVELIEEADLTEKSDFKEEEMMIDEPPKEIPMPTTEIEAKTAAERTLQELLGKIKETSIKRIGIWGMGGIGKTTIMKILNNHPETKQMFDIVIWVTVSKEGTDRSMCSKLAERLFVKRQDGESIESLKAKVFQTLKAKKFLLLLDDVWDRIDLEELGVPLPDENNGCKVVLSTRDGKVCKKMKTDKEIKVMPLSEEESWSLFCREIGEVADFAKMERLARDVAKECCGLPLAIVVVGRALRKEEDVYVWSQALNELRSPINRDEIVLGDMAEEVFRLLKYSYDQLKHETTKECFLYCALYPEDWLIPQNELIEHWISEGFFSGSTKLEEARDEGFSVLKDLRNACLLEKVEVGYGSERYVKMHDLIRDLALRISSAKGDGCWSLVKAGVKLSEAPKAEDWEQAKRISLMRNVLKTLPQMPNCLMLTTLLLQGNFDLQEIPPYFFEFMPALQVLNLSETGIETLPPSIGSLSNLRGLYLNDCRLLKVVPSQVGALEKLEVFQMEGRNQICYLPPEIGDLESLKDFKVQCCPPANKDEMQVTKMFPKGLLSKLSGLERLGIHVAAEADDWWVEYSEGVSQEIAVLNKLTHLVMHFARVEHLEHFVRESPSWKQGSLTSFRFFVGQQDGSRKMDFDDTGRLHYYDLFYPSYKPNRMMVYNHGNKISPEIREILTRADTFAVRANVVFERLSDFGVEKMSMLKYCFVIGCQHVESIIDGDYAKQSGLLPSLQQLILWKLPNLKSIWEGPLPPPPHQRRCFPSLTVLELEDCPKLRIIFSRGLIQHLSNLEKLKVIDCLEVIKIISMEKEGGEMDPVELLPRLKTLDLRGLPKLTGICSKELSSASWPSLEQITISRCENLKSLPRGFAKAPNLQRIHCHADWWKALEWEDDAIKGQLDSKVVK